MSIPEDTPTPEPEAPKRSRLGLKIALGAGAVVLVAAGGASAYAWQQLSGGGTQPQDVLPASVTAFVRVDADPSASQKIALLRLIQKFPDVADEIGIKDADQDVKKLLLDDLVPECDLDYKDDIEPWLGDRVGVALDDDASPLFAIQVEDEKAAAAALPDIASCLELPDAGVVFSKGYAVLALDTKSAEAAVAEAKKNPLTDDKTFRADLDELGNQGLASAWVDFNGLAQLAPAFFGGAPSPISAPVGQHTDVASASIASLVGETPPLGVGGSVAVTLRAGSSHLEVVTISRSDEDLLKRPNAEFDRFAADDLLVGSYSGGRVDVRTTWQSIIGEAAAGGYDIESELAAIEDETGLRLPDDLETLLGENVSLVVGPGEFGRGVTTDFADPTDLEAGLVMRSNTADATDLARRLADLASQHLGLYLTVVETDDGAVLATSDSIAEDLANGSEGKGKRFDEVMPGLDKAFGGIVLNVDRVLDQIEGAEPSEEIQSVVDGFRPLSAIGFSVAHTGDRATRTTMRIEFNGS